MPVILGERTRSHLPEIGVKNPFKEPGLRSKGSQLRIRPLPWTDKWPDLVQPRSSILYCHFVSVVLISPRRTVFAVVGVSEAIAKLSECVHGSRVINDVRPPMLQPEQFRGSREIALTEPLLESRRQPFNLVFLAITAIRHQLVRAHPKPLERLHRIRGLRMSVLLGNS